MVWDYFGKAGSSMGLLHQGSSNQELDRKQQEALEPMLKGQAGRGGVVNNIANNIRMSDKAAEIAARDRLENTVINDVPVFGDTPTRQGTFALEMGRLADQGYDEVPPEAGVLSTTPPEVDPATPPAPVPDAVQDPGGHIAASAGNRANGLGNMFGMPKMPEMPNPKEVEAKAMGEQAKQVMFDQNKIPEWHKSRAFSGGLLSLGLNLLSGNDLATSFAAAGEYFDKGFSKEKREAWANDLVEQGYDAQDIQRWIETGDNKDLTDPMEKKMKMMQYQTAEQNLANLQYESTPEMREYKRQMEQMPLRLQMQQMQQSQANANRTHDLALRKFEADQMKGAGYTYDPVSKGYKKSNLIGGKPLDKEGLKQLGYFGRAQNSVSEYENVFNKQGGIQAMQNRGGLGTFVDDMQMKALAS
ncbi:MAG: hypothetical protein ACRDCE_10975, partial [Cetobacterium sp.]|uniref:hypothetical protein n=1 Tax=Cetobacterium sp. TaxID=2071632 RepID=UPI003EE71E29